jgi:hypothetical protein
MPIGDYQENILLYTDFGFNEVFQLELSVAAPAPTWSVDGDAYEYSMNLIGQVKIDGTVSNDVNDIVAAMIDGEIVGIANINEESNGRYLVYMTIYNNSQAASPISFRIWDASKGLILNGTSNPNQTFGVGKVSGNLINPIAIENNDEIAYNYEIKQGWNWISFPLIVEDSSPESMLTNMNATNEDVIKGQSTFAQYDETLGWGGSLLSIAPTASYKVYAHFSDVFDVIGTPVSLDDAIDLAAGWNWISFLPVSSQTVNTALSGYAASDGDLIKSQSSFALYDGLTERWVGTLKLLHPGQGYLLKTDQLGYLCRTGDDVARRVRNDRPQARERSCIGSIAQVFSSRLLRSGGASFCLGTTLRSDRTH